MTEFVNNKQTQDHRYSRQSYTIGQDAQTKLSGASVLVIGYNSLAQEIVRNLTLIGISRIDIHHQKKLENYQKTGLYYPVNESNSIPINELSQLNPSVQINMVNIMDEDKEFDKKKIKKYHMVILTNSMFEDALDLNKITHKLSIPFVMCGCYGLMGYLFNDFGEKFQVNDLDGEISELLIVESIENKMLKFKDQHKLSDGDHIQIVWDDDTESEYKVYRKRSPILVELTEIPNQDKLQYKKVLRKKISKIFEFEPLKRNLDEITHVIADWSVPVNRTKILHKLHMCMDKYLSEFGSLPRAWSIPDYEVFEKYLGLVSSSDADSDSDSSQQVRILARKFSYTLKGDLLPMVSVIAGVVSHEVLKALTHKYVPITQWYYLDYLDLISDSEIIEHDDLTNKNFKTKSKYEGIVNIFGKKFLESFQNTVPFVIGSGAIGCELIKNLGMMGVKQIYLTDPDHIEKSNLSRQFLFSDSDIRQSKAETAAKKIKLMNPDTQVHVLKQKICEETSNIFDKDFHSKIDIYLNALDNVDARVYMDTQAIKYSKPLIDSGTMGSKGNVQVIIPHLTESYGSSKDPEEKAGIPICTIKSFPYKPEHTIQWARELFETEFVQIPNFLNKYKNNKELEKLNDSDTKNLIKQLYKYYDFELSEFSYLRLLFTIHVENHISNIKEIIDKYSKVENKEELGDKKLPVYLTQSNMDTNMFIEYITDGFKLLNQIFNTNITFNNSNIGLYDDWKADLVFPQDANEFDSQKIIEELFQIVNLVPNAIPIEFEKDDDELGHVSWITSSANMRNIQYFIPQTDLYETRRIAGNIIPAMITTTSLISGFQILEYIRITKLNNKTILKEDKNYLKHIDLYKNRFVNLNTNYLDGINPSKMQTYKLDNGKSVSVWTNYIVSSLETSKIIEQIESETKKKIEFMTCGNKTVFDGDEISIGKLDLLDSSDKSNILVLLEDIPIGIPVFIK
jgi:ubiquitin-activating enzyme E1